LTIKDEDLKNLKIYKKKKLNPRNIDSEINYNQPFKSQFEIKVPDSSSA